MSGQTYRTVIQPEFLNVIAGPEKGAAGTPATTGYKELVKSCVTTITHGIVEIKDRFGMAQTYVDRVQTTHEAQCKIQLGWHAGGMAPRMIFSLLGAATSGAADATSGASDPYQHQGTLGTAGNRCNTHTIWHDTGDGQMLLLAFATVEELMLSWSEDAEVLADITFRSLFPAMATPLYTDQGEVTYVAPPSGGSLKVIGKDYPGTPVVGINAAYNIRGSSGSVYPNIISGGQIDLKRAIQVKYGNDPSQAYGGTTYPNPQQRRNPIDIVTGELMMNGVLDLEYLGVPTGGVHRDYLTFAKTGTASNPQKIKFIDQDSHLFELISWPWTYDMYDIQEGEFLTSSLSFTAFSDRGTLLAGNGSSLFQANLYSPIPATEALVW
jgi:hypothetical protein